MKDSFPWVRILGWTDSTFPFVGMDIVRIGDHFIRTVFKKEQ